MNFRTQIPLKRQTDNLIDYQSKLMLLGSCFSENIGDKFSYYKFQTQVNPFGILFHPKAIETFLERTINQEFYTENELILQNEKYHCLDAHSSLSNTNKNVLLENLNKVLEVANKQISELTHVVITLGTAWVYEYKETDKTVANCHKIPQKQFNKRVLSIEEIVTNLSNVEKLLKKVNLSVQLIYTVSPVRHIKDGFIENQQSKAYLLSAIHQFLNKQSKTSSLHSKYFPSYEIMMDELRDYRFYATDMIHPNQVAIDYVWSKFKDMWISESVDLTMKEVEVIQKGLNHKPFNPDSEQHQKFLNKLEIKKENLLRDFPFMKF